MLKIETGTKMLLNPGRYLFSFGVADNQTIHDITNIGTRKHVCTVEVVGKDFSLGMIHHVPTVRIARAFRHRPCSSVDAL